jgi:type I restriction enzyme R subunit
MNMVSQTNENALENCIEKALVDFVSKVDQSAIGNSAEKLEVKEVAGSYLVQASHGYQAGYSADFDPEFALDTVKFWAFLQATQANELAELQQQAPTDWQRLILQRLDRKLKKDGIVKVLKSGLKINNTHLTLLYRAPYNEINLEVNKRFASNVFSVTRQLHYSKTEPGLSIDIVLFINGLPVVTMELKNIWTGQTTFHAMKQYREDRDPKTPLLQFARCLVHFAVDTDDVFMTTHLAGEKTHFLPFNKGDNHGKGNPVNELGHKTDYLWYQILSRESLCNIIEHFAKLVGKKANSPMADKTLFFPRYHQLEVVRKILDHAAISGLGQTYLIQHSAGSGKSNSITWLCYQLIELYQQGQDSPVFDSVIVVTDRRVLDKQLRNNIKLFSEVKNIIARVDNSGELKTALETGKKIIITTIQKFL